MASPKKIEAKREEQLARIEQKLDELLSLVKARGKADKPAKAPAEPKAPEQPAE